MIKLYESFKLYLENYKDKYEKYYKDKIDFNTFEKIVKTDPTSVGTKKGKYVDWLLDLVLTNRLKEEDFYKATEYLDAFNRFNSQLPIEKRQIIKYSNINDLFDTIQPFLISQEKLTKSALDLYVKKHKITSFKGPNNSKGNYTIYIPNTKEDAKFLGKGTEWCTSKEDDAHNRFDDYNQFEPLYIFINDDIDTVDNRYQLFINYKYSEYGSQLADINDRAVSLKNKLFYEFVTPENIDDFYFFDIEQIAYMNIDYADDLEDILPPLSHKYIWAGMTDYLENLKDEELNRFYDLFKDYDLDKTDLYYEIIDCIGDKFNGMLEKIQNDIKSGDLYDLFKEDKVGYYFEPYKSDIDKYDDGDFMFMGKIAYCFESSSIYYNIDDEPRLCILFDIEKEIKKINLTEDDIKKIVNNLS